MAESVKTATWWTRTISATCPYCEAAICFVKNAYSLETDSEDFVPRQIRTCDECGKRYRMPTVK